jgi:peptidoglycan/xylan/chitin deacetylase (PgdA/CDA1 family)
MGLRRVGLRGRALVVWVLVGGWSLGLAMSAGAQQIAITFDDLPAHGPLPAGETRIEVANKVIRALDRAHVPPTYGFVNGVRVEEEPDSAGVLGAWREAGFPLGNHTWSHMNLNQHSLREFEQDTEKNEGLLESQMRAWTGTGSGSRIWRMGTTWRNRWACECSLPSTGTGLRQ